MKTKLITNINNDILYDNCIELEEIILEKFKDRDIVQDLSGYTDPKMINKHVTIDFLPKEFICDSQVTNLALHYNVFTFNYKQFSLLKNEIIAMFIEQMNPEPGTYHLRGWMNIMRKGEYIDWHYHSVTGNKSWHGFYVVNGFGSRTHFGTNFETEKLIESIDGLLTMVETTEYMDKSSVWENPNKCRITIGYDILEEKGHHTIEFKI